MRRLTVALATVALGATAVACAGSGPRVLADAPRIVDLTRDAGAGVAPIDPARGAVVPAGQLRLMLEELLGVHGTLTVQMMREAATGGSALPAWMDALAANTAELSGAIGLVYGPDGARAFDQLWSFHTQFFLTYADSIRRHDTGEASEARAGLEDYTADFASFLATATGDVAPEPAVAGMLREHIDQLVSQLDAYVDGDLDTALEREVESHTYLATIGTTLAGAFSTQDPVAFPGPVDDPGVAFCSILSSRLTTLSDVVVTTAVTGGPAAAERSDEWTAALDDAERRALDAIGEQLDVDLSDLSDVFAQDQTSQYGSTLLAAIDRPTLELQGDAHDLSSFGPQLLADGRDATATPLAVRDAYATAYRLAAAARTP